MYYFIKYLVCITLKTSTPNAYSLFETCIISLIPSFKITLPSSIEVVLFLFDVGVAKKFILFLWIVGKVKSWHCSGNLRSKQTTWEWRGTHRYNSDWRFFFLQINLLVWRRLLSQLVFRGLFCLRLGAPWYLLLLSHCWLTWHSTCVEDLRGPSVWTEVGRESLGYQLKTGKTCCRLYLIYDNHTSFCTTHQYSYTI